jgi:hypothetical protein
MVVMIVMVIRWCLWWFYKKWWYRQKGGVVMIISIVVVIMMNGGDCACCYNFHLITYISVLEKYSWIDKAFGATTHVCFCIDITFSTTSMYLRWLGLFLPLSPVNYNQIKSPDCSIFSHSIFNADAKNKIKFHIIKNSYFQRRRLGILYQWNSTLVTEPSC